MTDQLESILEDNDDGGDSGDAMKDKYLTFLLEGESFGIEIRQVTEIVGIQPIIVMPEMPEYIKGIINLRGKIIPVIDIRLRFKKPPAEYGDRTCIIVIELSGGSALGLIVDSVSEVLDISEKDITEKPEISARGSCGYIKSIGKSGSHVILLLECHNLLSDDELDVVSAAKAVSENDIDSSCAKSIKKRKEPLK